MSKSDYKEFCSKNSSIPIFSQPWYLDCICGEDKWDVIIIKDNGIIVLTMPYFVKKKKILMPDPCQFMGPLFHYPKDINNSQKVGYEIKWLIQAIEQLPKFKSYYQKFHYSITNWLPFYWIGYKQSTRYTYRIENKISLEEIYKNFKPSLKRNINKAKKIIKLEKSESIEIFYHLFEMTFTRQNQKTPISYNKFKEFNAICKKNNSSLILLAKDDLNNYHSGIYLLIDKKNIYYMFGGSNPEFRNSQSLSLLMWNAIQLGISQNKSFDFEGSMIQPIENFFRSFGANQVPYFELIKLNHWTSKLKNMFDQIMYE